MRVVEELAAATSFLTRVPTGRVAAFDEAAVARAAPLYPLVGAAVGALAGGVVDLSAGPLPAFAAAALGLGVAAVVTGGMHLDALADTADALGGMTRERRLEIMRDHAIGSFGAVALVLVLLFQASTLAAESSAWTAFAAAGACARWSALPLAAFLPSARADGQGAVLAGRTSPAAVALGLVIACALALGLRGWGGLAAVGAAAGVALVLGLFFRHWLGGVTGDTLGATTELAQAAALAALLVAA
jgi:cobalamin 5'-phosphate synthase/cobalamin synthase